MPDSVPPRWLETAAHYSHRLLVSYDVEGCRAAYCCRRMPKRLKVDVTITELVVQGQHGKLQASQVLNESCLQLEHDQLFPRDF